MTAVFRSCLPRTYSNTNHLSEATRSIPDDLRSISPLEGLSETGQLPSSSKTRKRQAVKVARKRGPRFTRIPENPTPLLTRLVGTIFGDPSSSLCSPRLKEPILPSAATLKTQFDDNEKTLRSLVTLLGQIESNVPLATTSEDQHARNNNRMDDTCSSHSNGSDEYHPQRKAKELSKRCHCQRRTRKELLRDHLSCSSLSSTGSSPILRRNMVDNQQQTHLSPTKTNTGTSTQAPTVSEPAWFDLIREDRTTNNAWARIRQRLKPTEQKDILRALMIICANLFEVPLESKQM